MALKDKWTTAVEEMSGGRSKDVTRWAKTRMRWQREAWWLYDEQLAEVTSSADWIGKVMGLMNLVPKTLDSKGREVEDKTGGIENVIARLGDISDMLKTWGTCSVMAGEAILVPSGDGVRLHAEREVVEKGKRMGLSPILDPNLEFEPLQTFWRIYIANPGKSAYAASPMQTLVRDCCTLNVLKQSMDARIMNRIMFNGMMFFGSNISMPMSGQTVTRPDDFFKAIRESGQRNMRRRGTAADSTPIIFRVGAPEVKDVFDYWEPPQALTETETNLRAELRNNFREAFDLPVEMQTSMEGLNHWGAWAVTDQARRLQLRPRATVLSNALSASWYQEALHEEGAFLPDKPQWLAIHDAQLDQQAESTQDARAAYDRGEASGEFLRAVHGIDEDYRMEDDPKGYVRWLGRQNKDPYLATFGMDVADDIDWTKVRTPGGRQGQDTGTNPADPTQGGAPDNQDSEVTPPGEVPK